VQVADVLQLVVQHCPEASQIRTLCSLLQVSRTVQQAVQQAVGSCSLVLPCPTANASTVLDWTSSLAACCAWLPKHAGLVTSLSLGHADFQHTDIHAAFTAHIVVSLALRLCAAEAQAAAACALPWRLGSLTVQWLITPELLNPLSTCTSLTRLDLTFRLSGTQKVAAVHAALGRLQTLQELSLQNNYGLPLCSSFAAGISCLTRLQRLALGNLLHPAAAEALPGSIQTLTVLSGHPEEDQGGPWPALGLQHLVGLEVLHLQYDTVDMLQLSNIYPEHIQAQLRRQDEVVAAAGLQRVRSLFVADGLSSLALMKRLSSLQQLRELDVGLDGAVFDPVGQVVRACLGGIAAAMQLTKLVLSDRNAGVSEPTPRPCPLSTALLHGYLQQLTQLQHLDISSVDVQPYDAVHFTALKSLTALHMYNCWNISDMAVVAIVLHLSNLRVLELIDCALESPALWPAVGLATGLERLCLDSAPNNTLLLDATALGLLTGLTRLTSLTGPHVLAPAAAYDAFLAAMPALVEAPPAPAG
jgi:hypothetical protein